MRWGRAVLFVVVLLAAVGIGYFLITAKKPPPVPILPAIASSTPMPLPTPPVPVIVKPLPSVITEHPKPLKKTTHQALAKKVASALAPTATPTVHPPYHYVAPVVVKPPEETEPTEWRGTDTQVRHPGQVVIKSDEQWIHFWTEHHPHEVSPDVDFSKRMVIGVFAGSRPADSFSIEIAAVHVGADAITVNYKEHLPPTGTFSMGVEVFPYDLKAIPRSALPVKFNILQPQASS